ncbi:Centromere protein H CENP-H, partial [Aspergillus sclerotialis]
PELVSGDNVEEQLVAAERELLQSRATYTVRRKAAGTVLMTDPTLKAVHMKATTPAERALLRLVNRRDVLSFAHENLAASHNSMRKTLSNLELENLQINRKNQKLVRQLLELTGEDASWKEELDDPNLKAQLEELETERKKNKAKWEVMKNIASAVVVGSGVNWAEDKTLIDLVLDEMDD